MMNIMLLKLEECEKFADGVKIIFNSILFLNIYSIFLFLNLNNKLDN
jgi:hypothetical protein